MANDFQTKTLKASTVDTDIVPVYTTGEVTVHALFISNITTVDKWVTLAIYDGAGTAESNRQAYLLFQTTIPSKHTMVIDKPINLDTSITTSEQRRLRVHAETNTSIEKTVMFPQFGLFKNGNFVGQCRREQNILNVN